MESGWQLLHLLHATGEIGRQQGEMHLQSGQSGQPAKVKRRGPRREVPGPVCARLGRERLRAGTHACRVRVFLSLLRAWPRPAGWGHREGPRGLNDQGCQGPQAPRQAPSRRPFSSRAPPLRPRPPGCAPRWPGCCRLARCARARSSASACDCMSRAQQDIKKSTRCRRR